MAERPDLDQAVRRIQMDQAAVKVIGALAEQGVPSLLLKGAASEALLHDKGAVRPQLDIDILVPPGDRKRAEETLAALGYELRGPQWFPRSELSAAGCSTWDGEDRLTIDLHTSLHGIRVSPARAFEILAAGREELDLGWAKLPVLSLAGRTLHIALHADQHGDGRTTEDLDLAIAHLPFETWQEASELASSLGAGAAFRHGLEQSREGTAIADRMGLPAVLDSETLLGADGAPPKGAVLLEKMLRTPGLGKKLRLARKELTPPFTHLAPPLAESAQSRADRALAYARAALMLPRLLLPAAAAVWRARRAARRVPSRRQG